jgi:phosphatidylserine/phosphatidylglycerophosphate/cardiolipin synthase-like enzyme
MERIGHDVALIGSAKRTLDIAAFVLSDKAGVQELHLARMRGVTVRIVLDRSELRYDRLEGLGGCGEGEARRRPHAPESLCGRWRGCPIGECQLFDISRAI